ncbi:hypothetical protein BC939DRAFT_454306 [Gamsiella multidivaricata]|uniref:uncharacterized protein n=1 Tax=Gamsiella multidivaricata TaxID=101098 RepID=UPI00221EC9C4|nr:uncharacterized protein BC939DRAFT_454306 [Gamsiella multidivaricata]KAI7822217.1 hypothetical protein BC939DRAFT_454306 [Gamsiella multidivaricata]
MVFLKAKRMNRVQLTDSSYLATATRLLRINSTAATATATGTKTKNSTAATITPISTTTTAMTLPDTLDCAICLDNIRPKYHAKAILACRHEFHLSCISVAFSMGNKEMICPLCRFLHKDQPFMGSDAENINPPRPQAAAVSTSTTVSSAASPRAPTATAATFNNPSNHANGNVRNRHRTNSIHLQHNLSNLVQHQQRRRQSMYDIRRSSISSSTPLSSPTSSLYPSTPLSSSSSALLTPSLSTVPSAVSTASPAITTVTAASTRPEQQSQPSQQQQVTPAKLTKVNAPMWSLLYALLFAVASHFLSVISDTAETLWSKLLCFIGIIICFYMAVWVLTPIFQQYQQRQQAHVERVSYQQGDNLHDGSGGGDTHSSSNNNANSNGGDQGSYYNTNGHGVSGMAMEYEFDVQDSFTPRYAPTSYTYNGLQGNTHPAEAYLLRTRRTSTFSDQQQQQQQQQRQTNLSSSSSVSPLSPSSASSRLVLSWFSPGVCSLGQWVVSNRFTKDALSRVKDLVELMDDFFEHRID